MARKKRAAGGAKVRGNWSAAEIEEKLRRYHRVGTELVGLPAAAGATAAAGAREVAERGGLAPNRSREFRRFAAAYTPADLEGLIALRTPQGTPPAWGVVRQLMAVKDLGARESLQRQAVTEGWSAARTASAVRRGAAGGARSSGGRPLASPAHVLDALRQVELHGGGWLRRCEAWKALEALIRGGLPAGGDSDRVKADFAEARRVLRQVAEASIGLEAALVRAGRAAARPKAAEPPEGGAKQTAVRRKKRSEV